MDFMAPAGIRSRLGGIIFIKHHVDQALEQCRGGRIVDVAVDVVLARDGSLRHRVGRIESVHQGEMDEVVREDCNNAPTGVVFVVRVFENCSCPYDVHRVIPHRIETLHLTFVLV